MARRRARVILASLGSFSWPWNQRAMISSKVLPLSATNSSFCLKVLALACVNRAVGASLIPEQDLAKMASVEPAAVFELSQRGQNF